MKKLLFTIFGLVLSALVTHAGAVTLSLLPATQNAIPGDTVSLDLVIDGFTGAESLGAFDVDILYDTNALTFIDYNMGSLLGDIGIFEALDDSRGEFDLLGNPNPGVIDLAEVSLLFPFELEAIQPDSFTLATLDFSVDVLAKGSSTTVSIDDLLDPFLILSDANGVSLTLDGASHALISNPDASVPEPSTLILMGLGLVGMGFLRKKIING